MYGYSLLGTEETGKKFSRILIIQKDRRVTCQEHIAQRSIALPADGARPMSDILTAYHSCSNGSDTK